MMMRMLVGIFLGLLSSGLVAADDADEMDWEEVDRSIVGDRTLEEEARSRYLMNAMGGGAAMVGIEEEVFMEVEVQVVPQDLVVGGIGPVGVRQENGAVNVVGMRVVPQESDEELPVMFDEEDAGADEEEEALHARREELMQRLRVLQEEQQELEARRDQLQFELYATPAEFERLVPEMGEANEGVRVEVNRGSVLDYALPFFQAQPAPTLWGLDLVGTGW